MIFTLLLLFLSACEKDHGLLDPAGKIRTNQVDPPRSLRLEEGDGNAVDIRWYAPSSDAGFSGRYNVEFKRRSNATYNFSYETDERTYNVNVIRDTTYDYRVRSLASAGWEPSDWVTTQYTLTHEVAVESIASETEENDEVLADEADETAAVAIPDETAVVAIPDATLRRYIERVLKKDRGATITHADMRKIVNLLEGHTTFQDQDIEYRLAIKSLVGLEAATNLQNVAIAGNKISDVSPLANLLKLRYLNFNGNQISDVSPLVNLPNLRYLNLNGNLPLNDVSINEHVPALQRRGVEVILSPYERTFPDSPFDIELVFVDDFTEDEQEILRRAAKRWEAAIQADIPDYTFSRPSVVGCGGFFTIPAGDRVDDLRIYLVKYSAGGGAPRGVMSVDLVRSSGLPLLACVQMNEQKLSDRPGELWRVALHEIGHALGIGATWHYDEWDKSNSVDGNGWKDFGLLRDPYSANVHFAGPQAIAAFDQAGGTHYQGAKVPVDRDMSHWHSILEYEIMAEDGRHRYLSAITLGALSDMGYTVDFSAADPYELPPLGAAKPVADAVPFCGVGIHPPVYVDD